MARVADNDPLEKFRFVVGWSDSLNRAGFHDCQLPKRTTGAVPYREGTFADATQFSAGLNTFEDVVLNRGLVSGLADTNHDFYTWAKLVHDAIPGGGQIGARAPLEAAAQYRKDITIKMMDREGNAARAWILYNAFPTHYIPGSDLNAAEDGDKSMESLTLKYENFAELDVAQATLTTPLV